MARTVKDANLQTREGRSKLKIDHQPYWRGIELGAHVGYRKGKRGGVWMARWRTSAGGYKKKRLGVADDVSDADGIEVLDWAQAQEAARQQFVAWRQQATGKADGDLTVARAMEVYLEDCEERGVKGLTPTRYSIDAHILPKLGAVLVADLTAEQIQSWHRGLSRAPARLRSRKTDSQKHKPAATTAEQRRQRQATANRVLGMLKAALNHAFASKKVTSDEEWRRVKPFKKVDAPRIRYLSEADAVRLINGCAEDFRPMVQAALLTGCRYAELTRLECRDFNPDVGLLHIREAKGGQARDVVLTDEGQAFFAGAVAGRSGNRRVFTRPDGEPWGKSHQKRRLQEACDRAKIAPAISFHGLRHTAASWLAMKGVPMAVIAEMLGHSDTRMAEQHYAHLAPSYVKDTIRQSFPTLGVQVESKVSPLTAKKNR